MHVFWNEKHLTAAHQEVIADIFGLVDTGAAEHTIRDPDEKGSPPEKRRKLGSSVRRNLSLGLAPQFVIGRSNLPNWSWRRLPFRAHFRICLFSDDASWLSLSHTTAHIMDDWWFTALFPPPIGNDAIRALRWLHTRRAEPHARIIAKSLAEWEELLRGEKKGKSVGDDAYRLYCPKEQRRSLCRQHGIAMPRKKSSAGREAELSVVRQAFLGRMGTANPQLFFRNGQKSE